MAKRETNLHRRRLASDLALVGVYAGVILALFGGFAFDHVFENMTVHVALVSSAMAVLVGAGIWLDQREARREGAFSEE